MKTKSVTKVTLLSIFVMSVITAVTLNSCQKEVVRPKVVNTSSKTKGASNFAVSSAVAIEDINSIMFSLRKNQKGLIPGDIDSSSCVAVTMDTVTKPHVMTFDYGNGCAGHDGKIRSGIVQVTFATQDIRVVNNVITATFQNYSVAGTLYNGSVSLSNYGPNGSGNTVIAQSGQFSVMAQQQITPDTATVYYEYEWLAGENSSPAANYQFSITGGAHSSQLDSLVITTPLIKNGKNPGCNYYIQGTEYSVSPSLLGPQYKYTDYGTPGGCSGQKAVTQNGVTTIVNQ